MDPAWFEDVLYPLQDQVLAAAAPAGTGFYLTGGTALGRIHLRHRYSEDLDLFVNDGDRFGIWADRLLETWRGQATWRVSVQRRDPRFIRALVAKGDAELKIARRALPAARSAGVASTRWRILRRRVRPWFGRPTEAVWFR